MNATIEGLFLRGSPSTIVRAIGTIIVDTVQRTTIRFLSHVGEKIFKVHPSFADSDASSPVVLESSMLGIEASLFHRIPNSVYFRDFFVPRQTMGQLTWWFAMQTAATLSVTRSQVICRYCDLVSAIALAKPKSLSFGVGISDSNQSAIAQICSIFSSGHARDYSTGIWKGRV